VFTVFDDRRIGLVVMCMLEGTDGADVVGFIAVHRAVLISTATGKALALTTELPHIPLKSDHVLLFCRQLTLRVSQDLGRESSLASAERCWQELGLSQALITAARRAVRPFLVGVVQMRLVQPAGLAVAVAADVGIAPRERIRVIVRTGELRLLLCLGGLRLLRRFDRHGRLFLAILRPEVRTSSHLADVIETIDRPLAGVAALSIVGTLRAETVGACPTFALSFRICRTLHGVNAASVAGIPAVLARGAVLLVNTRVTETESTVGPLLVFAGIGIAAFVVIAAL
jgi:hypothetical protein